MGCCQSSNIERKQSQQQEVESLAERPHTGSPQVRIRTAAFVQIRRGRIEKSYQLTQKLGDGRGYIGAYGIVYKAIHLSTGEVRAVKTISKKKIPKAQAQQMLNEVEILKQLVESR